MADDLSTQITAAADEPAAFSNDGRSLTSRSIPDLIAADKHLAAKSSGAAGLGGLVRQVINPSSALG